MSIVAVAVSAAAMLAALVFGGLGLLTIFGAQRMPYGAARQREVANALICALISATLLVLAVLGALWFSTM